MLDRVFRPSAIGLTWVDLYSFSPVRPDDPERTDREPGGQLIAIFGITAVVAFLLGGRAGISHQRSSIKWGRMVLDGLDLCVRRQRRGQWRCGPGHSGWSSGPWRVSHSEGKILKGFTRPVAGE